MAMDVGKEELEACPEVPEAFVHIIEDGFGFALKDDGEKEIVRRYTMTNQRDLTIQVITYGARITCIKYPDKNGILEDVVLGFDDLAGYIDTEFGFFGATIGRYANRIAKGHFRIGNKDYQLSTNLGEHHFHGGYKGFDKVNWKSEVQGKKIVMTYLSKDGDEGYPGEVLTSITFELTTENEFIVEMKATSSEATPINITQNTYYNLGGHSKGAESLYEHEVSINADRFCHTDDNFIPTGLLKNVVNTLYDLRIPRKLGSVIPNLPYGGYDQNMCIHKTGSECMTFAARVVHPISGRLMELYSNQPGVQFFTCNFFPKQAMLALDTHVEQTRKVVKGTEGIHYLKHQALCLASQNYPDAVNHLTRDPDFENEEPESEENIMAQVLQPTDTIIGKDEAEYNKHGGFCLMSQKYPDSVHRKNFPNCILKPGETYYHIYKLKFDIVKEVEMYMEEDDMTETDSEVDAAEQEEAEEDVKNNDDLLDDKLEENGR